MRVEFEFTIDELVDSHMRLMARSKVARSWRWEGLATMSLFTALFAYVINSDRGGIVWAGIGAMLGAMSYLFTRKNAVSRRLRKYFIEQLRTEGPFTFQVELSERGISTRQLNNQITFEWANVEEILETEDSIDIYVRGGSGVFVRKRAFVSKDDMKEFINLAKRYFDASRISSDRQHAS